MPIANPRSTPNRTVAKNTTIQINYRDILITMVTITMVTRRLTMSGTESLKYLQTSLTCENIP